MKIFLIGFMGSGKTTLGKKLARRMGFDFIDLDNFIEQKESLSVPEIFAAHGEDRFRQMEADNLRLLEVLQNVIISTGGGAPCFYGNMEWMNMHGLTVYLKMSPESLYTRLTASKKQRPLLHQKPKEELLDYIAQTLEKRKVFYESCKLTIDAAGLKARELERSVRETFGMGKSGEPDA